jgi:hypothetical protein
MERDLLGDQTVDGGILLKWASDVRHDYGKNLSG